MRPWWEGRWELFSSARNQRIPDTSYFLFATESEEVAAIFIEVIVTLVWGSGLGWSSTEWNVADVSVTRRDPFGSNTNGRHRSRPHSLVGRSLHQTATATWPG